MFDDIRHAMRTLRKSPGFTAVVILSLALGIGANSAVFQLIDAVRLKSIPVKDPQQLAIVQLADRTGWRGSQYSEFAALTNPLWERFRVSQDSFSGVLAWAENGFSLGTGSEKHTVHGLFVS